MPLRHDSAILKANFIPDSPLPEFINRCRLMARSIIHLRYVHVEEKYRRVTSNFNDTTRSHLRVVLTIQRVYL